MAGDVKHDYHLVKPSPWPLLASLSLLMLALGTAGFMKGLWFIPAGALWAFLPGFVCLVFVLIGWWGDVIKESRGGDHSEVVQISLRYGMVLFIASEVMFFVAWFWSFFEMTIFHALRASATHSDLANPALESLVSWSKWPVTQVDGHQVVPFDPFHLPLINTLILLLSGTTVTWAHHALQVGDRKAAKIGLVLTIVLGALFTAVQVYEYDHILHEKLFFSEDAANAGLYGSAFMMATGFHGFHVLIGTIFLAVCLIRLLNGAFTPKQHFGFEAAAWYWHFVDVVWLFLFAFIYVIFGTP